VPTPSPSPGSSSLRHAHHVSSHRSHPLVPPLEFSVGGRDPRILEGTGRKPYSLSSISPLACSLPYVNPDGYGKETSYHRCTTTTHFFLANGTEAEEDEHEKEWNIIIANP